MAVAIDTRYREIILPIATTGDGISGEMERDMMLDGVERRLGAIRSPHVVQ